MRGFLVGLVVLLCLQANSQAWRFARVGRASETVTRSRQGRSTLNRLCMGTNSGEGDEEDSRYDSLGLQPNPSYKSGFVTILGNPNVGKSTLLNALLGQKLSITSPKPQTTRERILGILSSENSQIVFTDTPGILTPQYRLQETMQSVIRGAVFSDNADALLVVSDVHASELEDSAVSEFLRRTSIPIVVAVNKADLPSPSAKDAAQIWTTRYPQAHVQITSATAGQGVQELHALLQSLLPLGPKYYPDDYLSDRDERFFASEIIRETLFLLLHDELPYGCQVVVDSFLDKPQSAEVEYSEIAARILVNRQSHKAMVIGKGGSMIQRISERARPELEKFLGRPVRLALKVGVDEGWRDKPQALQRYGYML